MTTTKETPFLATALHQTTLPILATAAPNMSTTTNTSSNPPSHSTPPKPEPLLITSSFWGRTVHITPLASPDHTLYKIHLRNHKPHYTFEDDGGTAIAAATTTVGASLAFTLHGRHFTIPLHSHFINTEFGYRSPSLGTDVVWKSANPGPVGEIVCATRDGVRLGRFVQRTLYKEVGVLEFEDVEGRGVSWAEGLRDEVVVVGVVLAWLRMTQSSALLVGAAKVFSG